MLSCFVSILGYCCNHVCLDYEFILVYIEFMRSFYVGQIAHPLDERSSIGDVLESEDKLGSEMSEWLSSPAVDPVTALEVIFIGFESRKGVESLGGIVKMSGRWKGSCVGISGYCNIELYESWVSSGYCLSVRDSFYQALYSTSVFWVLSSDSSSSYKLLSMSCPFHLTKYCMFP